MDVQAASKLSLAGRSAEYWRRRLFRNSYTRGGRCFRVRAWSIKIQRHGVRRTFRLGAATRAAAALEAAALYQGLQREGDGPVPGRAGWPAVLPPEPRPEANDAAYWKNRLVLRRYALPARRRGAGDLSVRIEHLGRSGYFPLGTQDREAAAARALTLYQTVVGAGWERACDRFAREVTVALHWADNPLAWTYATLHTMPSAPREEHGPGAGGRGFARVALVEPDPPLRRALVWCLEHDPACRFVVAFANAGETLAAIDAGKIDLVLVQHNLPPVGGMELRDKIQARAPGLHVILFSVHEDSDRLFQTTPGGAQSYLLKRTRPDWLLEPLAGAGAGEPGALRPEAIRPAIRHYFLNALQDLGGAESAPATAKLTQREHEILSLVSKGFIDKEIGETLAISVWTVHGHLKKIFEKLHAHTRTEAVVRFLHK